MKKVKVAFLEKQAPKYCYAEDTIRFSWLGPPCRNVFPQVTGWHTCRETFASEIQRWFNGSWGYKSKMQLKRMRFTCIHKHTTTVPWAEQCEHDNSWFSHAKRILNIFEKYLGWGLTTISSVESKYLDSSHTSVFVVSGSCKWMRTPQLLSLYLLILRLSRQTYFKKLKSIEDLDELNAEIAKIEGEKHPDVTNWENLHPYLLLILDNYKDLFFHRSMVDSFKNQSGIHGINNMIRNICDNVTKQKFRTLKAISKNNYSPKTIASKSTEIFE